jgi:hypothetical protein
MVLACGLFFALLFGKTDLRPDSQFTKSLIQRDVSVD